MKFLKYALLICFVAVLVGIFSQALLYIPNAKGIMAYALFLLVIFGTINFILAIRNKNARIEASMISSSSLLILGFLFTTMYWKGGNEIFIIGCPIYLFSAIVLTILCFKNKTKRYTGLLYLALSMNSLLFLFKTMHWSFPLVMYITIPISLIIFIYVLIKLKGKFTLPQIVISIIYCLIINFTVLNDSQIYRFKRITLNKNQIVEHLLLYRYAWYLNKEDKKEEAELNMNSALEKVNKALIYPNNWTQETLEISIKQRIIYKKAIELLKVKNWDYQEIIPRPPRYYKGGHIMNTKTIDPNFIKAWELYNKNQKEDAIKMLTLAIDDTSKIKDQKDLFLAKTQYSKALKLLNNDKWTKFEYEEAYINIRYNIQPIQITN